MAEAFYDVHREKDFFRELVSFISSGKTMACILEGNDAINVVRIMIGQTRSYEASPGTIRGDFGLGLTDNIIHASDTHESFIKESKVIFGSSEVELIQPVVVVLGHVDSGKTSLLDKIRGTAVQAREVGGITQHIGASFFPIEIIKQISGSLFLNLAKSEAQIPGLLVIDTPGHEVFANLRIRGGSVR